MQTEKTSFQELLDGYITKQLLEELTVTNQKIEDFNDDEIFEKLYKEELSRNKNYEFFKTERGRLIHGNVKLLQGILADIKKGASIISVKEEESLYILKIERKELNYTRTVMLTPIQYKFFKIEKEKLQEVSDGRHEERTT